MAEAAKCKYFNTPVLEGGQFHTPHNAKSNSMLAMARALVQLNARRNEDLTTNSTVEERTQEHVNALLGVLEKYSKTEIIRGSGWSVIEKKSAKDVSPIKNPVTEGDRKIIGDLQNAVTAVLYEGAEWMQPENFEQEDLTMGRIQNVVEKVLDIAERNNPTEAEQTHIQEIRSTIAQAAPEIKKFLKVA